MKLLKSITLLTALALTITSCSKDDNLPENEAPVAIESTFSVSEDITGDVIIGTVQATDNEEDMLSYSISVNPNNLFKIDTTNGQISLADGEMLDYETTTSYILRVQVSDANTSTSVRIVINVTDVFEGATVAFKMVFETTTNGDEISIPINPSLSNEAYDYTVDWGDGIVTDNLTGDASHTYKNMGTYTVSITGKFPAIYFNKTGDDLNKLKEVTQWGNMQWQSMNKAFRYCKQLNITATDVPDLSHVTEMSFMFDNVYALNTSLNNWDVSNVTNMAYLFAGATSFNQPLDQWDVSNVTNMSEMFLEARKFNQDISDWNVESATSMYNMFRNCYDFSQDLSGWDTTNVTNCTGFNSGSALTSEQLPTLGCF
ncbi:BspA family leucine-rich repeat surface protein [Tenacibaculum insulae]|uniref:BspA family leucine-rich repeat surface protein n=1 Tax=Tenacibaculum insulae TaxID=2029677 RepID=UPI003AB460F4